jgi:hypothetical protein
MKDYKSTEKRLAQWFEESRDNWKEKALQKQKKLRKKEVKIRDLEKSREEWKEKAKKAEKELEKREEELKEAIKEAKKGEPLVEIKAKGHHYSVKVIKISIKQIIKSNNSLRGVQKNWEIWQEEEGGQANPSFSIIRQWLGRIGLFELKRKKEKREDWIFITDLTVELGQEKCLVILGVSQEYYLTEVVNSRALNYQDVEVLGIEIMKSTQGELIKEKLEQVGERVGIPRQIVSDHGSDLHKGIKLYQENNPEIIHTYDLTHQIALLLKQELEADKKYQEFYQRCHQCRQQIQQTELLFISPPSQRSKARYLNLEHLIKWGQKILLYEEKQDFSLINKSYVIDAETLVQLIFKLTRKQLRALWSLSSKELADIEEIKSSLSENLMTVINAEQREVIIEAASRGSRRFLEKFGWLKEYKNDLIKWSQMLEITDSIERLLKHNGLHQKSLSQFDEILPLAFIPHYLVSFHQRIRDYLIEQTAVIKDDLTFLATSDIIESIFGKYKLFSERCPLPELGRMILTIPLATMNLTADLIKQALETVSNVDVKAWQEQLFGISTLSKRKIVFSL